jgi:copper(I)-binding protein
LKSQLASASFFFTMKLHSLALFAALACGTAYAQNVEVRDAWIRSSVQGQKATGAFMKITSKGDTKLVSVSSPVAGVAEVHEMKMEGDVMKMRAIPGGLDMAAGKTVELKPGGYHVMLMDLKAALAKDSTVPLTLVFKDAKGAESKVELKVPVATSAPGVPATKAGDMPAMDHSKHKP